MKPQHYENWKKTREKGFGRYVLLSGVLAWGLPMFVVMTFVVHGDELSPARIAIGAVVWPLAGVLFGVLTWWTSERQYRKHAGEPPATR